jgi:two-component system, cell cycle sensor histidine kinase and response regulator CckA
VKVYLPRADAAALSATPRPRSEAPRGSERILLVEDEHSVRELTARVLTTLGYDVVAVADAEAALAELAAPARFDLLLTDLVLPAMSGRVLAERAHELRPAMRVLFTSGYSDDVVLRQQLVTDDAALLAKPFTIPQLAQAVRRTIDSAGAASPANDA